MPIHQFVFQPTTRGPNIRDDGPEQVLTTGTLEQCQAAWSSTVTGHYRGFEKCPAIGLLADLGNRYSFHQGGKGSYTIRVMPELTENPVYEVRPANETDWRPAGDSLEEAEVVLRRMGTGAGRLLVLRNNFNGSLAVYEANDLGWMDFKGTYESFYGGAR
jgi:hypothetical protein